jgi:uncharacterized repeat protein (TIGR03806 family)
MRSWFIVLLISIFACQTKKEEVVVLPEESVELDLSAVGKATLSAYGFFEGELRRLTPAEGVVPYSLNAALFSDYAFKQRFIKIPAGKKASYNPDEVFEFPEGTVLIKNFYYPADFRNPTENIRILETRLLMLESGTWKTLPYIWNDEQTEAFLNVAGKNIDVSWTHVDGSVRRVNYSVPNMNQCKNCHLQGDQVIPIGPSARQLNGDYPYESGSQNQLAYWRTLNMIENLPAHDQLPALARYDDSNELVANRARAWLEINCAHCHRANGPAKNSGLHLLASVTDLAKLGVGKAPVAAGKGSGGLTYGIVPGKPDESILQFRIESTHPGIMMPELGRTVVDEEGVKLVRQWIAQLK